MQFDPNQALEELARSLGSRIEGLRSQHLEGNAGSVAGREVVEDCICDASALAPQARTEAQRELWSRYLAWSQLLFGAAHFEEGAGEEGLGWIGLARATFQEHADHPGLVAAAILEAGIELGRGDHQRARAACEAGFDVLAEQPGLKRQALDLYDLSGRAAARRRDIAGAIEAYQASFVIADELGLSARKALNRFQLGNLQQAVGETRAALASYSSALALGGDQLDGLLAAELQRNLALLHLSRHGYRAALEAAELGMRAYEQLAEPVPIAALRNVAIRARIQLGQAAAARSATARQLAALHDHRDRPGIVAPAVELLGLLRDLREFTALGATARLVGELRAKLDCSPAEELELRIHTALAQVHGGEVAQACDAVPSLLEEAEQHGDPVLLALAVEAAAEIAEQAGDPTSAMAHLRRLPALRLEALLETLPPDSGDQEEPDDPDDHRAPPLMRSAEVPGLGDSIRTRDLDRRIRSRVARLASGAERQDTSEQELERRAGLERERRLEVELLRAQRMESVGRLAGGVAHDFNNLLTVIQSSAQCIAEQPSGSSAAHNADMILDTTARGAHLVGQLLAFGCRQDVRLELVRADALVTRIEPIFRRLVGEAIELRTELGAGTLRVEVDREQFESVLFNLVLNACDAMPDGGRVTIRTSFESGLGDAGQAEGLRLIVRDEGTGIAPEHRALVFDPFFTTRAKGAGAGMGLASSLGIMKRLGGDLRLLESSAAGSAFELWLPMARSANAASVEDSAGQNGERCSKVVPAALPSARLTGQRILVVEDNEAICRLIASDFERRGARVQVAHDGIAGLACLRGEELPDLVVCDVIMPGMGGPELFRELEGSERRPPFLFVSGYPDRWSLEEFAGSGLVAFLPKPFDMATLAAAVTDLLAEV